MSEIRDKKWEGMSTFDMLHQSLRNGTIREVNLFRNTNGLIKLCRANANIRIYQMYGTVRLINWMELELYFMMEKIREDHCE